MSDDNKDPNQEDKAGNSLLGKLLEGAEDRQGEDPHSFDDLDDLLELEDDLAGNPEPETPSVEAPAKEEKAPEQGQEGAPELKAEEAEEKEGASPEAKAAGESAEEQKGADIIDMATRKSTPTTKPGETPFLVTGVADDAAMLRKMSSNAPLITGKDASLVQFNGKTGRIEPVDNEAAATLKALGDNADLYVSRPPSTQQTPMTYNPESFSLDGNPRKNPRPLPTPGHVKDGLSDIQIAPPTSAEDRLKRVTGQDAEANKDKKGLPGHEDQGQKNKEPEQPPTLTAGAMLIGGVGRGIASLFSLFKRFVAWTMQKLGAIADRTGAAVSSTFKGLKSMADNRWGASTKPPLNMPEMSSTQRAGSAQEAGTNLKQQVEARKQNLQKQAMETTQDYRKSMESQVKTIGESLGVHKAGSTLIRSKEDYDQRFNSATPNEKTTIANAQKAIAEQSEHFRDKLESVIKHRDMNLIPMADREDILSTMQQSVSQPMKLTKMEQAALEHGANPYIKGGESTTETIQDSMKQAHRSIQEATEQLKSQQAIEGTRQAQQAQQTKVDRMDIPFYSGFGQSN